MGMTMVEFLAKHILHDGSLSGVWIDGTGKATIEVRLDRVWNPDVPERIRLSFGRVRSLRWTAGIVDLGTIDDAESGILGPAERERWEKAPSGMSVWPPIKVDPGLTWTRILGACGYDLEIVHSPEIEAWTGTTT